MHLLAEGEEAHVYHTLVQRWEQQPQWMQDVERP